MIGVVPELTFSTVFRLENYITGYVCNFVPLKPEKMCFFVCSVNSGGRLFVKLETNVNASLPIAIGYDVSPIDESDGTVYAVVVLVGLYVLIIFEAKIQTAHYIKCSFLFSSGCAPHTGCNFGVNHVCGNIGGVQ